jgi:predicted transcriptional regulator
MPQALKLSDEMVQAYVEGNETIASLARKLGKNRLTVKAALQRQCDDSQITKPAPKERPKVTESVNSSISDDYRKKGLTSADPYR